MAWNMYVMEYKMVKIRKGELRLDHVALNLLSSCTGSFHTVPRKRGGQAEKYRKLGYRGPGKQLDCGFREGKPESI